MLLLMSWLILALVSVLTSYRQKLYPWRVLNFIIFQLVRNGCFQTSLILMCYHIEI